MKKLISLAMIFLAIGCVSGAPKGKPTYMPAAEAPAPPPPPKQRVSIDPVLRDSAREMLTITSHDSDPVLRANAIEAMQDTLGNDAADNIVKALDDPEPLVRFAAAMAAGRLRLKQADERLVALADEPDVNCKVAARFALHRLGDTHRSHDFETYARYPDRSVRANVALALGLLGEPTALRVLRQMTSDTDPNVRLQAAEGMWRLGDPDGLDTLVVGTVSEYPDDQIVSLLALAEPRDARVAGHLKARLTSEAPEVALAAALRWEWSARTPATRSRSKAPKAATFDRKPWARCAGRDRPIRRPIRACADAERCRPQRPPRRRQSDFAAQGMTQGKIHRNLEMSRQNWPQRSQRAQSQEEKRIDCSRCVSSVCSVTLWLVWFLICFDFRISNFGFTSPTPTIMPEKICVPSPSSTRPSTPPPATR